MMKRHLYLVTGILVIVLGLIEIVKKDEIPLGILLFCYGIRDFSEWRALGRSKPRAIIVRADDYLDVTELTDSEREAAVALWDSAIKGYDAVEDAGERIRDRELKAIIARVQAKADTLLDYIEAHPKAIVQARKFIETYQARAAKLATEFSELERSGLETSRVTALKDRLKTTLADFESAYAVEFERILNSSILSTEAEVDVVEQVMAADDVRARAPRSEVRIETTRKPHGEGFFARVRERIEGVFARTTSYSVIPEHERSRVIAQKIVAGALGVFLGSIGAHKFFLGKTRQGILYILFCWTFIPGLVGFIEGVRYLFMPLDDFYKKVYR